MSVDKKEEVIIDVVEDDFSSEDQAPPQAVRKISFFTKFFVTIFSALLIYHLVTSWIANRKISTLTEEVGKLKLENQTLTDKVSRLSSDLTKTKTNLDYVESDSQKKTLEVNELKTIVDSMKKNAPEGSRLLIERLEKKLALWEEYYKTLDKTLKERPGN